MNIFNETFLPLVRLTLKRYPYGNQIGDSMKSKLVITVLVGLGLLASDAFAGRHDRRQGRQSARIRQGVKSGELTKGEAHRLRKQQRKIGRVENRAEADGVVTAGEKARLENMQDRASQNIYRKKHNDRDQGDQAPQVEVTE